MADVELKRLQDLYDNGVLTDEEYQRLRERAEEVPEREVLSTGMHLLDTRLNGGILSGSLVALIADPLAMPGMFLYHFCESRRTVYFTTDRKAEYVRQDIASSNFEPKELQFVDVYSHHYHDDRGDLRTGGDYEDRRTLDFVMDRLKRMRVEEEGINIVFDSFSFFENLELQTRQVHLLLNYIYETSKDVNGLTYLLSNSSTEDFNNAMESTCDVVMRAEVDEAEKAMKKVLYIPKLRGGTPPDTAVKYAVESDTGIKVDTSRLV